MQRITSTAAPLSFPCPEPTRGLPREKLASQVATLIDTRTGLPDQNLNRLSYFNDQTRKRTAQESVRSIRHVVKPDQELVLRDVKVKKSLLADKISPRKRLDCLLRFILGYLLLFRWRCNFRCRSCFQCLFFFRNAFINKSGIPCPAGF